ncbi:phage tail tape measure protein [Eggerthia catenaformis]|nr:phage tail tape measure protein [Eggerthia catenaformis]
MADTNVQVNFKMINSDFRAKTKEINNDMKELRSEFRLNESQLKATGDKGDYLKNKTSILSKEYQLQKDKVEASKKALEQTEAVYGENSEEAQKMRVQLNQATAEMNNLKARTDQASESLKKFEIEQKMKKAGESMRGAKISEHFKKIGASISQTGKKLKDIGDKMSKTGKTMTTHLTAPILAGAGLAVKSFKEVDEGMDIIIQKTGASGEALKEMQASAKNLATTISKTSFEDAGTAIGEVNTRFEVTGKTLEKLSADFIRFAKVNKTDLNSSIDSAQKTMAAWNIKTKDAGDYLDTLTRASQISGISIETLQSQLQQNAGALKDMGLSASDAAYFLADVEKSGLDTQVMMTGLAKAQKNSASHGKTLTVGLQDFSKVMKSNASDTKKLQTAIDLFGAKAGGKIYNAMKTGKLSLESFGTALSDAGGTTKDTFKNMEDGLDKIKPAMNKLKLAGSQLGAVLSNEVGDVITKVSDKLSAFSKWFNDLSPSTKKLIVNIGLLVAAIGPVIFVIGKIIFAIGTIGSAIGSVISFIAGAIPFVVGLLNPVTIAITPIIAVIVLLYTQCKWFRNMVNIIIKSVVNLFISMAKSIITVFTKTIPHTITAGISFFKSLPGRIWSFISSIPSKLANAFKFKMPNVIGIVSGALQGLPGKVWSLISSIPGKLASAFSFKIPKIKLPHLKMKGKFSVVPPQVPTFGVDWYAKGALFTGPTIIGNRGLGEAGDEYALPLNASTLSPLARMITNLQASQNINYQNEANSTIIALLRKIANKSQIIAIDGKGLGSIIDSNLGGYL